MQGINKGEKMLNLKIDVIKFIPSVEYGSVLCTLARIVKSSCGGGSYLYSKNMTSLLHKEEYETDRSGVPNSSF